MAFELYKKLSNKQLFDKSTFKIVGNTVMQFSFPAGLYSVCQEILKDLPPLSLPQTLLVSFVK